MTAATFSASTGQLAWRGYWKSRDDMERLLRVFEEGEYADSELAQDARAAIQAHDAYWKERTPTVIFDPDRPF